MHAGTLLDSAIRGGYKSDFRILGLSIRFLFVHSCAKLTKSLHVLGFNVNNTIQCNFYAILYNNL